MAGLRFSFSAGPAALPPPVRERIREDLVDWDGSRTSILEASQWNPQLLDTFAKVETDLREILTVPDDYAVLFLHGGASNQFAMVPMNLLGDGGRADYLHTGLWSGKAVQEARRYGQVNVAASTAGTEFRSVPAQRDIALDTTAHYVHYTPVETAHGIQFDYTPETGDVPLVADATAALLVTPLDIGSHGVVYASTQKNLGVVGMTVVIVRRDLIGHPAPFTPTTFDYAVHQRTSSRFTTPPAFAWYVTGLVLDWVREQGGLPAMIERSRRRAEAVYSTIDASAMFTAPVDSTSRAWTNVVFALSDANLTETFLKEAEEEGLFDLRGHSAVGGVRASLYLGMPEAGAHALGAFLTDFEARHG